MTATMMSQARAPPPVSSSSSSSNYASSTSSDDSDSEPTAAMAPTRTFVSNGNISNGSGKQGDRLRHHIKMHKLDLTDSIKKSPNSDPYPVRTVTATSSDASESHKGVRSALSNIGARPLVDYVGHVRLQQRKEDEVQRIIERKEQQRQRGINLPMSDFEKAKLSEEHGHPILSSGTQRSTHTSSSSSATTANLAPILMIPCSASTKLSRSLRSSPSGALSNYFKINHGKSYVAQLNELLQAMGTNGPEYDQSTQFQSRLKSSPDFFVTVTVHHWTFIDEIGKSNIKAGRECVAQMALEYLLGITQQQEDRAIDEVEKFSEVD
ncbi:unnamed protein product [Sympodiomycopsis kandeliae]